MVASAPNPVTPGDESTTEVHVVGYIAGAARAVDESLEIGRAVDVE